MEKLAYKQILPYLPADLRDMLRRADQELSLIHICIIPPALPHQRLTISAPLLILPAKPMAAGEARLKKPSSTIW